MMSQCVDPVLAINKFHMWHGPYRAEAPSQTRLDQPHPLLQLPYAWSQVYIPPQNELATCNISRSVIYLCLMCLRIYNLERQLFSDVHRLEFHSALWEQTFRLVLRGFVLLLVTDAFITRRTEHQPRPARCHDGMCWIITTTPGVDTPLNAKHARVAVLETCIFPGNAGAWRGLPFLLFAERGQEFGERCSHV